MKIAFKRAGLAMPVSQKLMNLLSKLAGNISDNTTALTFNFRDKSYSAEDGGYHPVEIRISKTLQGWQFEYITDFSYQGYPYAELVKEVDFDFNHKVFSHLFMPDIPLSHAETKEFYQLWEGNFISYVEMDCFDEIKISKEEG